MIYLCSQHHCFPASPLCTRTRISTHTRHNAIVITSKNFTILFCEFLIFLFLSFHHCLHCTCSIGCFFFFSFFLLALYCGDLLFLYFFFFFWLILLVKVKWFSFFLLSFFLRVWGRIVSEYFELTQPESFCVYYEICGLTSGVLGWK